MSHDNDAGEDDSAADAIETRDSIERDRFATSSRLEITQIMNALRRDSVLVTAMLDDKHKFLTSVLAVNERADYLVLERAREALQNERVLGMSKLLCSTQLDRISIRFECTDIAAALYEGHAAIKTALPRKLSRLQRREYYRMSTPLHAPVKCALFAAPHRAPAPVEANVIDISCGGIGVIAPTALFAPKLGDYYGCTINLPGTGMVGGQVQVRNAFELTLPDRTVTQRSGMAFTKLPENMLATIQRYNMNLERVQPRAVHR